MEDDDLYFLKQMTEQYKVLPAEEQKSLAVAAAAGDRQALERLVLSSQALVVSVARRHLNQGLELLDLVQEGNIGLLRAVEKFDLSRGTRFSTHATWWIRQAITLAIRERGRMIRLPRYVLGEMSTLKKIMKRHEEASEGLAPSSEELAAESGLTKERVVELLALLSEQFEALEELISSEEESAISSTASVPASPDVSEELEKAVACLLSPREREVIELRFGLIDGYCRTQVETGEVLGLTSVGVGQAERRALAKLRNSASLRELL